MIRRLMEPGVATAAVLSGLAAVVLFISAMTALAQHYEVVSTPDGPAVVVRAEVQP